MALTGIAAAVDKTQVHALLLARAPEILNDDPGAELAGLYEQTVSGVATEVAAFCGTDPTDADLKRLAVWCVTLGVAAQLEASLFPEQQLGDFARAKHLQERFATVLAMVRAVPRTDGPDDGAVATGGPRGSFPDPTPYPDPARGGYSSAQWGW